MPQRGVTKGQRVAGWLLLAGAVPGLWIWQSHPAFISTFNHWFVPQTVIDLVLGILLAAGAGQWPVRLAIVRSAVSLLVLLGTGGAALGLLAVGLAAQLSLLLLLWGVATTRRIVIGCGVFTVLAALGVAVQLGLAPPFLRAMSGPFAVLGDLAPATNQLHGTKLAFRLTAQDESWQLLTAAGAAKFDKDADLVAVNVETGAVVSAYVHERAATELSVRRYTQGVLTSLGSKPDIVEDLGPLPTHPQRSRLLRLGWYEADLKERWKGLRASIVGAGWGLQLSARVRERAFETAEPALRKLLESVTFAPERLQPPEGMTALETARLAEPEWPFRIELRAPGWHRVTGKALSTLLAGAGAEVPPQSHFLRRLYTAVDLRLTPIVLEHDGIDARQVVDFNLDDMRNGGAAIQNVRYEPSSGTPGPKALATFDITVASVPFHVAMAARTAGRKSVIGLLIAPVVEKDLFEDTLKELERLDLAP